MFTQEPWCQSPRPLLPVVTQNMCVIHSVSQQMHLLGPRIPASPLQCWSCLLPACSQGSCADGHHSHTDVTPACCHRNSYMLQRHTRAELVTGCCLGWGLHTDIWTSPIPAWGDTLSAPTSVALPCAGRWHDQLRRLPGGLGQALLPQRAR